MGVGLPGPWVTKVGLVLESVVMALGPGSTCANVDLGSTGPSTWVHGNESGAGTFSESGIASTSLRLIWHKGEPGAWGSESLLVTWVSGWSGALVGQGPVARVSQKHGSSVVGLTQGLAGTLGL